MSAPPYMKLFWGDYHRDTRHLTREEHGAYFLLLGEAWNRGGVLPDDDVLLARWALATAADWARLKPVVMALFKPQRGRWKHKRISEELASYDDVSRKRKLAGKRGGSASHGKRRENPEAIGGAIAKQKPTKPEPEPEPNIEDKSACEPPRGAAGAPDEVGEAFALWNAVAKACGLPVARDLTPPRRKLLAARLSAVGPEGWSEAMACVTRSRFLRGMVPGRDGGEPFRADLDYVLKAANFQRIIEGGFGSGAEPPVLAQQEPPQRSGPDRWRSALEGLARDAWWPADLGPRPGKPGCLAPVELLAEFGHVDGVTPLSRAMA